MPDTGNDPLTHGGDRRASPWRVAAWSAAALVLGAPLVLAQVTNEVTWSVADFALAGALVLGVGVPLELAARRTGDRAYRGAVGLALAAAVLLVAVDGTVGVVGSEEDDVNLLFGGVLAVALVGALVARFRPRGMARAMAGAALAQASVAVGALVAGLATPSNDLPEIVALWGFVALWAGSAALFRRAARTWPPTDPWSRP